MFSRFGSSLPRPVTRATTFGFLLLGFLCPPGAKAQKVDPAPFETLSYRQIGPAIMGGRATDVEGVPGNPNIVYGATAGSGLLKTENAGITWKPLFEREGTLSIGDIALDPRNPEVIWLGSGEANMRNSVSFGDGVYKSLDGGKTWQHMGLKKTEHISRVMVNPLDPNIVFVAAVGHAAAPNEERGVFRTVDGGKSWEKVLYIDDKHGASDLDIDPVNPNIVYAAMWRFERRAWTHTSGSERGGVYRSTDGGNTWKKLEKGLPRLLGRIGVKLAPSNPNIVYVAAESKEGVFFRSTDRGDEFKEISKDRKIVQRGFYYADIRVDPLNENRVYTLTTPLQVSIDGGKSWTDISPKTHVDYHAIWIDPTNPKRIWQAQDGGFAVSYDQGAHFEYRNNFPLGQFYQVNADMALPFYNVSGGLQDNGTWVGPSRTRDREGILNDDWRMIAFGDGFYAVPHPENPNLYLAEAQGGALRLVNTLTGSSISVSPQTDDDFIENLKYRFNWNTPIVASPHGKTTVYFGANVLFQTNDFGKTWEPISGDLTTNNREKLKPAGGPVWLDNSTAENNNTIISIAESPVKRGVIWVGTDDGNVQVSADGGKAWKNVTANIAGAPREAMVSSVAPSRVDANTAYVSIDAHFDGDFGPYIYRTKDGGSTWTKLSDGIPASAYVHVVREDPKNADLLYAGTELGLYVSWNAGTNWSPLLLKNMPKVAIHDLLVHPRDNDLILGTHGRSVLVLDDIRFLQEFKPEQLSAPAHLFPVRDTLRYETLFTRYGIGDGVYAAPNPPYGALLTLHLKEDLKDEDKLALEILDSEGKKIASVGDLPRTKGIHRVAWNLQLDGAPSRKPPSPEEAAKKQPEGGEVVPGTYTVRLTLNGTAQQQPVRVALDPTLPPVPPRELTEQREMADRALAMQSAMNVTLLRLDSLKRQMKDAEAMARAQANPNAQQIGELVKTYTTEADKVTAAFGIPTDGSGLEHPPGYAEKLANLASTINGFIGAPLPQHKQYFEELRSQFPAKLTQANTFFRQTLPQWDAALRKLGAQGLTPYPVLPDPQ
ncbi:MAG: hypothetical protein U5J83_02570 [Bryobacterales bacterium]|nr:hypothetical protein [Bryobacterales bacterium]